MIVAIVALWAEKFLVVWRYVGYKSCSPAMRLFLLSPHTTWTYLRSVGQEIEASYTELISHPYPSITGDLPVMSTTA
jgi:hypothetical protein